MITSSKLDKTEKVCQESEYSDCRYKLVRGYGEVDVCKFLSL